MRRPKTLWKSRSVEKPKNRLFHHAWKSRPVRGIPTFPQRRRRLDELQQPDISLATKSGHFNLLRTEHLSALSVAHDMSGRDSLVRRDDAKRCQSVRSTRCDLSQAGFGTAMAGTDACTNC